MEDKKFNVDKLHLKEFKIIRGQIESPYDFVATKSTYYQFEVGFNLSFNFEEKLIKANLVVDITSHMDNTPDALKANGLFEFCYIFFVENMEELAVKKDDNDLLDVAGILPNHIAAISFSTSRGVLLTRFQGTALANFILPIFDPNKLLVTMEETLKK